MNAIYPKFFVTAIRSQNPFENGVKRLGWFSDIFDARHLGVNRHSNNKMYDYLVVEEAPDGLNPIVKEVLWFKWTKFQNLGGGYWCDCQKPEFSKGITNWSIG